MAQRWMCGAKLTIMLSCLMNHYAVLQCNALTWFMVMFKEVTK